MEMTVFRTKVQRAVSEALGEEYSVELREVQKNNGVILQGLMIRRAQENMLEFDNLVNIVIILNGNTISEITCRNHNVFLLIFSRHNSLIF